MPGRYEGAPDGELAAALDLVVVSGIADDEFGSVDEGGAWALVLVTVESLPDPDAALAGLKAGNYVVLTDEQGFLSYDEHDTPEAARASFDGLRDLRAVLVP